MPRPTRADEAGAIYHALNRVNLRSTIFRKDEDRLAFVAIRCVQDRFSSQFCASHSGNVSAMAGVLYANGCEAFSSRVMKRR